MEKVRVLQGCSIQEGGIWYHQGAILLVANSAAHTRTVTDEDGKTQVLPCVERVTDGADVNTPAGLTPEAPKAPEAAKPVKPAKSSTKEPQE